MFDPRSLATISTTTNSSNSNNSKKLLRFRSFSPVACLGHRLSRWYWFSSTCMRLMPILLFFSLRCCFTVALTPPFVSARHERKEKGVMVCLLQCRLHIHREIIDETISVRFVCHVCHTQPIEFSHPMRKTDNRSPWMLRFWLFFSFDYISAQFRQHIDCFRALKIRFFFGIGSFCL